MGNREKIEASLRRVISPEFVDKLRNVADAPSLAFPGGSVTPAQPTRAALIESAKQWATAAREAASEETPNTRGPSALSAGYIVRCCEHIERILGELAKMEEGTK